MNIIVLFFAAQATLGQSTPTLIGYAQNLFFYAVQIPAASIDTVADACDKVSGLHPIATAGNECILPPSDSGCKPINATTFYVEGIAKNPCGSIIGLSFNLTEEYVWQIYTATSPSPSIGNMLSMNASCTVNCKTICASHISQASLQEQQDTYLQANTDMQLEAIEKDRFIVSDYAVVGIVAGSVGILLSMWAYTLFRRK